VGEKRTLWPALDECVPERADRVTLADAGQAEGENINGALGHALVEAGQSVLFSPTFQLVQELLAAKRDLDLPRALRRLDLFDVVILDDIGYVQQSPDEIEVLFTFLAERYERRSVVITSNLVFSEWDRIFKNPMTTAAAIDFASSTTRSSWSSPGPASDPTRPRPTRPRAPTSPPRPRPNDHERATDRPGAFSLPAVAADGINRGRHRQE